MTKTKMFIMALAAAGLLFGMQSAQAHCDSIDGPVAKAVQKALEDGNVNPVLAYAPAAAETEIRTASSGRERFADSAPMHERWLTRPLWKRSSGCTGPAKARHTLG